MKELIAIKNQPAIVEVNFEELRASLATELEKYDVVVTSETVKEAKALATELNQTKKVIDDRRKSEVAKASEPVKAFDAQMKQLVSMCEEGRTKILEQVARFENETREALSVMLSDKRLELWEEHQVIPEFRKAVFEDLVIISNVTIKGNLAAKAKDALVTRVLTDKSLQQQTQTRLVQLENESFKSGLAAPLTRDHVAHFLFDDDARYQSELTRILNAEINRQEEAQARERERIERQRQAEQRAKAEAEERDKARIAYEQDKAEREAKEQEAKANAAAELKAKQEAQALADAQSQELERVQAENEEAEKAVQASMDHTEQLIANDLGIDQAEQKIYDPEQAMITFLCNDLGVFAVQARQIAKAIIQGRVPHANYVGEAKKAA
tara:strand:+ start:35883 stop:37031 length:1149 start_codon:yes stop_codon:yes gene_type:complete